MNSIPPISFPVIIGLIGLLLLIILLVVLLKLVMNLNASFAKLGYVAREDAKKYFGDAAEKVTDMNSTFYTQYQEMIDAGVRKVLAESGQVMSESFSKAEKQAADIVLTAQQEARQIIESTQKDSNEYYKRALAESVDAMKWALEQYLNDHLDIRRQEDIVKSLIEAYVDERRS